MIVNRSGLTNSSTVDPFARPFDKAQPNIHSTPINCNTHPDLSHFINSAPQLSPHLAPYDSTSLHQSSSYLPGY